MFRAVIKVNPETLVNGIHIRSYMECELSGRSVQREKGAPVRVVTFFYTTMFARPPHHTVAHYSVTSIQVHHIHVVTDPIQLSSDPIAFIIHVHLHFCMCEQSSWQPAPRRLKKEKLAGGFYTSCLSKFITRPRHHYNSALCMCGTSRQRFRKVGKTV